MSSEKRDWKKIVNESNGTRIFLPDQFTEKAKEFKEKREDLFEYLKAAAEKEITMNMLSQNTLFELRQYLAKNGFEDIWSKEMGWDTEALNEGFFVINIIEELPQPKQL